MMCTGCNGTGHPRGAPSDLCFTCKGSGQICNRCEEVPVERERNGLCLECDHAEQALVVEDDGSDEVLEPPNTCLGDEDGNSED